MGDMKAVGKTWADFEDNNWKSQELQHNRRGPVPHTE